MFISLAYKAKPIKVKPIKVKPIKARPMKAKLIKAKLMKAKHIEKRPGLAYNPPRRSRPLSLQLQVANAMGRKTETILLEGIGFFLCGDARGRKIETLDQGWGFGMLWADVVPSH